MDSPLDHEDKCDGGKIKHLNDRLWMPEMLLQFRGGGIDILKELRADPETRDIPVIVASNLGQRDIVGQALELGAKDYFIKSDAKINDILAAAKRHL